jgi:hypothetical protein
LAHCDSIGMSTKSTISRRSRKPGLCGGNSNLRGPIWFPVNFLIIEARQKFHYFLGDEFQIEFPTGSGRPLDLWQVSLELQRRLTRLFLRDGQGRRPLYGRTGGSFKRR